MFQHLFARINQRKIVILGPSFQKIRVEGRTWIAGLAGRVGHGRRVPVADVKHLPIGCAAADHHVPRTEGGVVGCKPASPSCIGRILHLLCQLFAGEMLQRVAEMNFVYAAPAPVRGILAHY
jgi:hypothetical protein